MAGPPAAAGPDVGAVPFDVAAVQRRTLRVLLASQVLAGAGLAAGVTVGALLAEDMLGSTSWSGLPAALFTLGSAVAAAGVGQLSQRLGRRAGLAAGYAVGALGGGLVVVAAAVGHIPLLLLALLLYGSGTATNLQARYSGADLAPADRRGRAVSAILVGTTLGAVVGPNLVGTMGLLAASLGIRPLAGPFILAAIAYASAAVVVLTALRPDPLLTARALAQGAPPQAGADTSTGGQGADHAPEDAGRAGLDRPAVRLGAFVMVLTQLVMVAIMTMTPIHLRDNGHGLAAAGVVISIHIAAMYLPSPLSGWLADRVGRRPVMAAAGTVLLAAGLVAATAPAHSVAALAFALALLGLGWNLGLVGGTALLTDALPLSGRARTQGNVDVGVAIAGAGAGLGSGLLMAATSYTVLALSGGLAALALIPALAPTSLARRRARRNRHAPPPVADR